MKKPGPCGEGFSYVTRKKASHAAYRQLLKPKPKMVVFASFQFDPEAAMLTRGSRT